MALALSVSSGCPDYLHVSKQISQVSVKPFDETHISTDKNRRVFKQLCLKQQWGRDTALYLYSILLVQHETDLAFHVAYTQGVWDAVLQLYHSNGISNKSRKSALKRAIRQGAWNHVIQMTRDKLAQQLDACDVEMGEREVGDSVADQCDACEDVTRERDFYDSVTTQRDRRLAFVEAVRQGEWRWAMRLCENGLTVTYSDLKFALNTCVSLDHWKHIGQIRLFSDDPRHYWRMLNLTLKAIIEADNLPAYLQLCNEADGVDGEKMLKTVLRKAFLADKSDFLVAACQRPVEFRRRAHVCGLAQEIGIKLQKWDMVRELVEKIDPWFGTDRFVMCVDLIADKQYVWQTCAVFLELWCEKNDMLVFDEVLGETRAKLNPLATQCFAEWCSDQSFCHVGLLLSLASKSWSTVDCVVDSQGTRLCTEFLREGFRVAVRAGKFDVAVSFLSHLSLDDFEDSYFLSEFSDPDMILKCRERGLENWVVQLAISLEKWGLVSSEIKTCTDQSVIDHTAKEAATAEEWTLVRSLLDRCSDDQNLLIHLLKSAVDLGNTDCVKALLKRVDPISGFKNILYEAVCSCSNREEVVRLCILSGVSTYQRSVKVTFFSPMTRALQTGQLPLVRLLHESGSISNSELHLLKNDADITVQLERQRRQDIVQYVNQAASNPASLQHLCRLTVSHLVGCRPGRQDRVASLPVPWCVQEYLSFADLS
ncbi:hypothetical protein BaRGS_00036093 [Batillaria attramentaria]|uniref:SOCS box domain-containing protein n=1 Tax=Batillaria attramentaria TaxID=370345 RepID=A0ABD0JCN9_9CAEN